MPHTWTLHDRGSVRHGRIGTTLSAIAVLFLVFDCTGKLLKMAPVVAGTVQLGYPDSLTRTLGVILALCVVTYVIPHSSMLGAVLLTGYLGGAVATHVRVGSPLLTHILFPVYVGVVVWAGLLFRDARLRSLLVGRLQRPPSVRGGPYEGLTPMQDGCTVRRGAASAVPPGSVRL